MEHRGRIQVQGENIEASEAWSQDEPLTKTEGFKMLLKIKRKIPFKESELREEAFRKAEIFIEQAAISNGVDAPSNVSFRAKGYLKERIDIEVIKGKAFLPDKKMN